MKDSCSSGCMKSTKAEAANFRTVNTLHDNNLVSNGPNFKFSLK